VLAGSSSALAQVTIEQPTMITPRALAEWERWKTAVEHNQTVQPSSNDTIVQDTVGAIAYTIDGDVSAGVSRSVIFFSIKLATLFIMAVVAESSSSGLGGLERLF
jgi:isoaspartyl peptidase/L-asparaginase-like protein (Ntn-hydrolase superfamily)